jgi:hypothetical protein
MKEKRRERGKGKGQEGKRYDKETGKWGEERKVL